MPLFYYQAFSKDGKKVTGYLDSTSSTSIKEQLIRQSLYPISITAAKEGSQIPWYKQIFSGSISNKETIQFTKQLAVLLKAGVPLLAALELLTEQFTGRMHTMLVAIKNDIKEGVAFATALGKYPKIFDKIYIQLVRAGEASGKLESILERLVTFYERREVLRKRVSGALTYPIIQAVIAGLVVVFLMKGVVPQLAGSFAKQGKKLPAPTRLILAFSDFLNHYIIITIIILGLYGLYKYIKSTNKGARALDTIKLKIPGVSYFTRLNAVVQFSQTLGLLLASGVNLSESLDIVCSIIDNRILADTLSQARDKIIKQGKITQYLKQTGLFPPIAIYMIGTGEESGQLDAMLTTVAHDYEETLGETADKLTASIGPIMLVAMAVIVGFIVAAVALPIIEMTKSFAK